MEQVGQADRQFTSPVDDLICVETENSIVRTANGHLIVTVGMKDCIVVHTPDATDFDSQQE